MIVVGEKINGARAAIGAAIAARDEAFIRDLARRQYEAGVDYLDVCAGTSAEEELEALTWLIEIVQDETDACLCVDSPDAQIIKEVLPLVNKPGLINSVSGEGDKCEVIYPLIADTEWKVVALTCNNDGIPDNAQSKIDIAFELIEKAADCGIEPERIFIDPLVLSLSAINECAVSFMEAIRGIKEKYPTVNTISGLSNISYGMPYRKIVNMCFLTLALSAGMDAAIIDPENRDMYAAVFATEALLDKDKNCRKYYTAYRKGRFGEKGA